MLQLSAVVLAMAAGAAVAQVPNHPPQFQMNLSTIIMPCNNSGFTNVESTKGWGIVDFDWSNSKAIWAQSKPMNDEELLFEQVKLTTSASPETTVWVYRCSVYAYPWYTSVRTILDDPAYAAWFIDFKPQGPYHSPKCDTYSSPPKCSNHFHMEEQTPGYPTGDGNCAEPCDCGNSPCGFYLWNHSSTAVVNGQTFQDWFIHSYMFNAVGSSPLVSGFFWDDFWPGTSGNFPDASAGRIVQDTGMTPADLQAITDAYDANMAALKAETLSRGKFAWQMLWTGGAPDAKGSTGPGPLVKPATCASDLTALCSAGSPQHTNRTMMYAFSNRDPTLSNQTLFEADLANFLLVRGDYAYLGHGWIGCSRDYRFPQELNLDYGVPVDKQCTESSKGVFTREWTKASVQMDCATFKGTVTLK